MTSEDAMAWVDNNRGMIIKMANEFCKYVPYDVKDYIQLAYQASIEAALCYRRNPKIVFRAYFLTKFRDRVAEITPFPDEARDHRRREKLIREAASRGITLTLEDLEKSEEGKKKKRYFSGNNCMSFPASQRRDVLLERIADRGRTAKIDISKVFNMLAPDLSEREKEVMELAVGVTKQGCLNDVEIARELGVTRSTVVRLKMRAFKKAEKCRGRIIEIRKIKGSVELEAKFPAGGSRAVGNGDSAINQVSERGE